MLPEIVKILTDSGIEKNEAIIETKLLIEHFSKLTSVEILMGKEIPQKSIDKIIEHATIRANTHHPIQYIIGEADFMGDKYIVNPSVLIPRDETEILVTKAIEIINKYKLKTALDVCTGSGCIACSIAKSTDCQVLGVDISTDAIHVAFENMENMELFNKAFFRKSDLFEKIREDETFDIIISNPPYIPPKEKITIQKEVTFEPEIALYTKDEKGLEFYQKIIANSKKHLNKKGFLLFELGINQAEPVKKIMGNFEYTNIQIIKDLAGIDRVIVGQYL